MLSAIQLRRIRLREQKKLNDTNLCLYKHITSYIQICSNLELDEKEEILQQIMDMILQAQVEDKSVDLFIGKDYEVFCDSIVEEFNNSRNKYYKIVNYVQKYLLWTTLLVIIIGISNVINGDSLNLTINLEQFIWANAMTLLLIPKRINVRFNIKDERFVSSVATFTIIFVLINLIIKKLLGGEIMKHSISLINNIHYLPFIFIAIGIIGMYKRLPSNR
jgi:DNA-binding ferritin-like protein (Dps family)